MKVREIALNILKDFGNKKVIDETLLEKYNSKLSVQDIRTLKNLVWGTIRYIEREDYYINYFIKDNKNLAPASRWILRLGFYQLINGYDEHAAIFETVELAKDKKIKSLVNAVLRNYLRNRENADNITDLRIKYSYPKELFTYIKKNHEYYKKIIEKNLYTPPHLLRVNTLKINREELIEEFKKIGIKCEPSIHTPYGVKVYESEIQPEKTELYKNGYFYIQNESSQLAAYFLKPVENDVILDTCSAPGGKTTFIAEMMKNKGSITAVDNDEIRLKSVNINAERLGIEIIKTKCANVADFEFNENYDKILIDPPCTSLGTSYVHPEVLTRVKPDDFKKYSEIQKNIIKNVIGYLKENGEIMYSTCTYSVEENTGNMEWLKENYNVEFIKLNDELDAMSVEYKYDGYGYYLIPDETIIPFYICKIRLMGK